MSRTAPALSMRFTAETTDDERDMAAALLSDFSPAIHELSDAEWRVFFRSGPDRDRAAAALAPHYDVEPLDVADEDWARRSQENLPAITIGDLVVAPPWDASGLGTQGTGLKQRPLEIVIEPSTGFGTGHHATTRLCLRALQAIDLERKIVIDAGTGSGVLAIAAALLGAARVIGIDNDPDALDAARENIRRNAARVDLLLGDIEHLPFARADVVLANLTGAMLRRNASALMSLAPRGFVVVSGFLIEEAEDVRSAFATFPRSIERSDEDGWVAFTLGI